MKDYKNKCIDCGCRVDNRTKRCKSCYDKWREETKDARALKFREYQQKWYFKNKDRVRENNRKFSSTLSPEQKKSYIIKYKYGIDINQYNIMLKDCNYKCSICEAPHSEKSPLNIDHCHTTKNVRGLLCRKCNTALGNLKDDIQILKNAIKYLKNAV